MSIQIAFARQIIPDLFYSISFHVSFVKYSGDNQRKNLCMYVFSVNYMENCFVLSTQTRHGVPKSNVFF